MPFPELHHWPETSRGLHRAALLLGAVQRLTQPPQPAYLELGLRVRREGLITGRLPSGGQAALEVAGRRLVYTTAEGEETAFALAGSTQASLFASLFGLLDEKELAGRLPDGEDLFARVSAGINAKGGRYRPPSRTLLLDPAPLDIKAQTAQDYWNVFQEVFTAMARFRAGLSGMQSPLVIWPEHFDLSTLWFADNQLDDNLLHINIGFAPFSEGVPDPYLYAYAYPYPPGYQPPDLIEGARWHTQGWTGIVIPYAILAAQPDPGAFVEAACERLFNGLRALFANAKARR